ncbi:holin [Pandoraea sputorum]|uniref:Holin n=1 Tax=Pandoraea sputorum TaxID=93222 RepID=A0A5E5BCY1_9BURK|nr:holin [Pandoraea sputorum]
MLASINFLANAVICAVSLWAVLTHRVPTGSAGAFVLMLVCLAAIGNMGSPVACHSAPEVTLNTAVAIAALWGFWKLQIQRRIFRGLGHDAQ